MKIRIWIIAGILAIAAIAAVYGLRGDPEVDVLNSAIEIRGSAELKAYPYAFRVWTLEGGVATMGSPRSPKMPVYRMIRAIDPTLSGKSPDNPDFVAAEKAMAKAQWEARAIVLAQPGVTEVKWELDRNWLISRQVPLD